MDWSAFAGAALGSFLVTALALVIVAVPERKEPPAGDTMPIVAVSEDQLRRYVVDHFDKLSPGWHIYEGTASTSTGTVRGEELKCPRVGRIDILAVDDRDDLVVIELKKHRAPDTTVAQVDRYVTWVERNLAREGQHVRGIILAPSFAPQIEHSLAQRQNVKAVQFEWDISISKGR